MPDAAVVPTPPESTEQKKSRAQDRFDELVAAREEAKRSRDSALQALAQVRQSSEEAIAELKAELSALKGQVQAKPSGPQGLLPSFESADDAALVVAATQGRLDPNTGQVAPPDPSTAFRAQMELLRRQFDAKLKAELDQRLGQVTSTLKSEQQAKDAIAAAERQILGMYGEAARPGTPLFKTAQQLMPHLDQALGKDYTKTPAGLQHLFAESARLLHQKELEETKKELETRRQELARLSASAPGSAAPSGLPDASKEALKAKNWKGALAGTKFTKSFTGDTV